MKKNQKKRSFCGGDNSGSVVGDGVVVKVAVS